MAAGRRGKIVITLSWLLSAPPASTTSSTKGQPRAACLSACRPVGRPARLHGWLTSYGCLPAAADSTTDRGSEPAASQCPACSLPGWLAGPWRLAARSGASVRPPVRASDEKLATHVGRVQPLHVSMPCGCLHWLAGCWLAGWLLPGCLAGCLAAGCWLATRPVHACIHSVALWWRLLLLAACL